MNKKEHEMMLLMFARVYQRIGALSETLKSRGLWTEDDEAAFGHLVFADDARILDFAFRARSDYMKCASEAGLTPPDV
jgi:hypothetical protein